MPASATGMSVVQRLFGGWTVAVLAFLYLPIALLIVYSFNASRLNISWQGFTLQWYRELWHNAPLIDALNNSLIIAAITTVLSVILGTAAAWLLYRYRFPFERTLRAMLYVPIIIPEVIMGISLLILFAIVSERVNPWLDHAGLGSPLGLGFATVILAHVTFCFPFVMIAVGARLQGLDPSLEEAAMDLGATPLQAFVRVILPYLIPSIVAGALMAFTLSIDEFVVTYFTYSAASITLPIKIYGMIKPGLNPSVNALSSLLVAATVVLAIGVEMARRLSSANASLK
jgi:spermidine/putrescine transport system permease protein